LNALGIALSLILGTIAALHAAWAARIWWPVRDEASLARTIAGFRGIERMPDILPSLAVTTVLFACMLLAADMSVAPGLTKLPHMLIAVATAGASMVFLARGLAGFTSFWARLTPEQPFRTLDRRYYSPLCILIGIGLATLVWSN
jgi:hypothetical protein